MRYGRFYQRKLPIVLLPLALATTSSVEGHRRGRETGRGGGKRGATKRSVTANCVTLTIPRPTETVTGFANADRSQAVAVYLYDRFSTHRDAHAHTGASRAPCQAGHRASHHRRLPSPVRPTTVATFGEFENRLDYCCPIKRY